MRMHRSLLVFCALLASASAPAQKTVPVEEGRGSDNALLQGQQRAELAYRQWQQAAYEKKLAEQDYTNTRDAYRAAQQRADDIKREVDAMKKALDAAAAKEAAARKAYDMEVKAIDRLPRKPAP